MDDDQVEVMKSAMAQDTRHYGVIDDRQSPQSLADLPDSIAELERVLEDRNPDNKGSCGALYQSSRRVRHKIMLWERGRSDKEFTGDDFDEVYRAAYEYAQRDEIAEMYAVLGLTSDGRFTDLPRRFGDDGNFAEPMTDGGE